MGHIILPHEMGLIEVFFGVSHCENVRIKLHILIPPPQTIHHEYFYILSFLYCLSWIDDPTANICLFAIIELSFSYISPCSLKTFRSIKCTYSIYAYTKMKNGQKNVLLEYNQQDILYSLLHQQIRVLTQLIIAGYWESVYNGYGRIFFSISRTSYCKHPLLHIFIIFSIGIIHNIGCYCYSVMSGTHKSFKSLI